MTPETYFKGLKFPYFGINRTSSSRTDTYPLFYGLQYVHEGAFYLSVNGGTLHQLKGPAAFLTSPDIRFCYGSPDDARREHYFVCFEGERVKNFLEKGLFIPADRQALPYIKINSPEAFLTDMLALILHLQTPGHHNLAVAKLEYMLLLLQHQESNNSFCGFHRPALQQLVHDIVLTPEQDWDFTAAAQNMNISLKHFRRIFLKFSGMSPVHFVLRQRILKACGMLVSSLDPIKSIANECGFKNEFYFSRIFKKYMKVSPENYRIKQPFTSGTFKNH